MSLVTIPSAADVTWMTKGICQGAENAVFFPAFDAPSTTAEAKKICARCPVSGECLDWAIKYDESGVWGGTSEADRRALKRRKSRVLCLVCGSEDILSTDGGELCLGCGISWRS